MRIIAYLVVFCLLSAVTHAADPKGSGAVIHISSNAENARISLDGTVIEKKLGKTAKSFTVKPGRHKLQLVHNNRKISESLTLEEGAVLDIIADFNSGTLLMMDRAKVASEKREAEEKRAAEEKKAADEMRAAEEKRAKEQQAAMEQQAAKEKQAAEEKQRLAEERNAAESFAVAADLEKGIVTGDHGIFLWSLFSRTYPAYAPAKQRLEEWRKRAGAGKIYDKWVRSDERAAFEKTVEQEFTRTVSAEQNVAAGKEGVILWERFLAVYPGHAGGLDRLRRWQPKSDLVLADGKWVTEEERKKKTAGPVDAFAGVELLTVQPGCFKMGDAAGDGNSNEQPAHNVCLDKFFLGKYEITQKQWYKIMETKPSAFPPCDDCPVDNVSWEEVQAFIAKLNGLTGNRYRLPSEAEWEYAARAGTSHYSGTDAAQSVPLYAWFEMNAEGKPHAAGSLKANQWGLFDLSGNVSEWVSDFYSWDYYTISPDKNPAGPATGVYRVVRGGSWRDGLKRQSTSNRDWNHPSNRSDRIGFRLAHPVM